ncbi:hypothetical protein LINPERHAP2_LOCUS21219 [Linum perenne]
MFHGPCGHLNSKAPCIDNICGKHFPKKFSPLSIIDEDSFPRYRRRDSGRMISKNGVELDDRYIVPYNRYLLLRFDAHINVVFCNKSRAIKYLFKYINKPYDGARAAIVGNIHDIIVQSQVPQQLSVLMKSKLLWIVDIYQLVKHVGDCSSLTSTVIPL